MTDHYCNQKFWWLTIEPELKRHSSCCAADTRPIDISWIKDNPGQMFNSPWIVDERKQMLDDQVVASCKNCWQPEQQGNLSRRLKMEGQEKTHTDLLNSPSHLNIVIGRDCNLDCVYCCKQYSTSWLRDIRDNGPYLDDDRYHLDAFDKVSIAAGQKMIVKSQAYQAIMDDIRLFEGVKELTIAGGEPFLSNHLVELVKAYDCDISIISGLGVNPDRLKKISDQLPSSIRMIVSADSMGGHYEFIRHGNTWDRFMENVEILRKRFTVEFSSVVSNLTVFKLADFQKEFGSSVILNFCQDPDFLNASVLDQDSKDLIRSIHFPYYNDDIQAAVATVPAELQIQNFRTYILEYARRRQLTFDAFPANFVQWIHEEQTNGQLLAI